MPTPTPKHRKNRGFTDAEILDKDFPNPQLAEATHRPLRHQYYREQVRKHAIVPWSSMVNTLLRIFNPEAVEEDPNG